MPSTSLNSLHGMFRELQRRAAMRDGELGRSERHLRARLQLLLERRISHVLNEEIRPIAQLHILHFGHDDRGARAVDGRGASLAVTGCGEVDLQLPGREGSLGADEGVHVQGWGGRG